MFAMPLSSGEITQFRAILAPDRGASHGYEALSPDALILAALAPLRHELDITLRRDDRPGALRLVYRALAPIAEALAAWRGDRPVPGQVRVHALLVEMEPLPLAPQADGTVIEQGAAVTIHYRNWAVNVCEAERWAREFQRQLSEQWCVRWPGAWFTITTEAPSQNGAPTGAGA
jgi:hypothetical protein